MKSKKIILFIFLLTFIFYFYRITIETKSRSVGLIMNYRAFLNYYNDENTDIDSFIDKILKYKINNISIYPSVISDMVNEYNEIFLATGVELNLYFNIVKFKQEFSYLVIPDKLKNHIIELDRYKQKFLYKNYLIYEFTDNRSSVNNISVNYIHKFEFILAEKKIHLVRLLNKPVLKSIDNFLVKQEIHYYLTDHPEDHMQFYKIHRFNKTLYRKEDIKRYIDENHRAVLERNVKGIMIHTLYLDNKIVKLTEFLPEMTEKIEKNSYTITRIKDINYKKNNLMPFFKVIIYSLIIILLYILLSPYIKYIKYIIIALLGISPVIMLKDPVLYIILLALFYYFINDFILRLNKENNYNIKNLLLFIGAILLSGLCISNFIFNNYSFYGPSEIIGIKFSFILPFIIWPIQYIKFHGHKFKKILKTDINLLQYILLNTAVFLIIFLILRSGNYYLKVSSVELKLRQFFENIFFIRPRFKEMIFYPFVLLLFFSKNAPIVKNNFFLIYFLSLIAVSTTINSFLHIHTLSYYSIIRSLIGMGIGFFIGGIFLAGRKIYVKKGSEWSKDRSLP